MPTWAYAVVLPFTVVPVPTVPMIVIVMALIIVIVVSILIVVLILIVIFRREGRYWKQQSRRYGANKRKLANHLVLHFCFVSLARL